MTCKDCIHFDNNIENGIKDEMLYSCRANLGFQKPSDEACMMFESEDGIYYDGTHNCPKYLHP